RDYRIAAGATIKADNDMQSIALFFLVAVAMGGVAWVFVYPILSGERGAERRRESVAKAQPMARSQRGPQKSRREQVEETLKGLEARQKKQKRPPLATRISQAGLTWSNQKFFIIAGGLGIFAFVAA